MAPSFQDCFVKVRESLQEEHRAMREFLKGTEDSSLGTQELTLGGLSKLWSLFGVS